MDNFELDELKALFLEECAENVDVLEDGLLQLGEGSFSKESLDATFRAAHSIKGGGSTFGFDALSQLTHHAEAYLEQLRAGVTEVSESALQIMLKSVDVMRDMLESTDATAHAAHPEKAALLSQLQSLVASEDSSEATQSGPTIPATNALWQISFRPNPDMAARGNDPYLILRELVELGDTTIEPITEALPSWEKLDPTLLYISWDIEINTAATSAKIMEVFEWVEFDCALTIEPIPVGDDAEEQEASSDTPEDSEPVSGQEQKPEAVTEKAKPESATMRVAAEKIDRILDLVGELVITQSMLSRSGRLKGNQDNSDFMQSLDLLERNTRDLQESVMRVRMLPISFAFGRLPRMVRDLSHQLNKKVDLIIKGESTEVDKTVLDHLLDPLVHLVRNAIDHGMETPEERLAAGKPGTGRLELSAFHQSGSIVIKVSDDGRGVNVDKVLDIARTKGIVSADDKLSANAIQQLIFAPGFSTSEEISEVSGRGVGMDVVKRNIVHLGGKVAIASEPNQGSVITMQLPLTLSILEGQLIQLGSQTFVVPIANVIETLEVKKSKCSEIPGQGSVISFREKFIPIVYLRDHLITETASSVHANSLILIVEVHGAQVGLVIDAVVGQQQVVIKSLEENYHKIKGINGATIMSDGSVALILDASAFIESDGTRSVA